jgi:hypothetical protein
LAYDRGAKKGTSFCRNIVPARRNSWKVTLGKKGIWKGIPLFLQELGSNSPGFLELEIKKGTQKGMHKLASSGFALSLYMGRQWCRQIIAPPLSTTIRKLQAIGLVIAVVGSLI